VVAENGETQWGEEQRRLARRCDDSFGRRRQQLRTYDLCGSWMRMVKPPPVPSPGSAAVGSRYEGAFDG